MDESENSDLSRLVIAPPRGVALLMTVCVALVVRLLAPEICNKSNVMFA